MTTKHHFSQFEKMRLNLDRLKRLLQQILDFRRIEKNLMELKVSQEHLPTFINQLSHVFFSPLALRKNIQFEIHHGECISDIYYDADKMDKILDMVCWRSSLSSTNRIFRCFESSYVFSMIDVVNLSVS